MMKLIIRFMVLVFLVTTVGFGAHAQKTTPVAIDGELDLSTWDFVNDGAVAITGDFWFIREELVDPKSFPFDGPPSHGQLIPVPGAYSNTEIDGQYLEPYTHGTYRAVVKLPTDLAGLAITLPDITSAYAIYVNGVKKATIFRPATNENAEIPGRKAGYFSLNPGVSRLDIVIHVSNYTQRAGNFFHPMTVDLESNIETGLDNNRQRDYALVGSGFMVGCFTLTLFIFVRFKRDYSFLFYTMACGIVALRVAVTGSQIILDFFPELGQITLWRFEYFTFYAGIPIFYIFYWSVFPQDFSRYFGYFNVVLAIILSLITFTAPMTLFSQPVVLMQFYTLVGFIWIIVGITMAMFRKRMGARTALIFIILFFMAVLHEIARARGLTTSPSLVGMALIVFLAGQAALLAVRQSRAFEDVAMLSYRLAEVNRGLEDTVAERTRDLEAKSQRLEASQNRLTEVLESAPIGVLLATPSGGVSYVNRTLTDMVLVEKQDVLDNSFQRFYKNPEDVKRVFQLLRDHQRVDETEFEYLRADGSSFWALLTIKPLEIDGEAFFLVWIYDITKRKQAEEGLLQAEKMASLGGLVAGVAHEVNTPIGSALTAATFIEEQTRQVKTLFESGNIKKTDFQNYIELSTQSSQLMLSNLTRAAELVQSFKQVAVDQASEERRKFDLASYLEEIRVSLTARLRKTPHKLEVTCPEGIMVDSYPGAISQVVTNLIINALIHAFEGLEVRGLLKLSAQLDENDRIEIVFSDNGRGIPPGNLKKIFEPFYTTKRGSGGSGLGLNIVFNLVNRTLGGTIQVASEVGNGTRFTIRIPRVIGVAGSGGKAEVNQLDGAR